MLEAHLDAVETKVVDMESIGAAQSFADDGSLARELEAVKRMSRIVHSRRTTTNSTADVTIYESKVWR